MWKKSFLDIIMSMKIVRANFLKFPVITILDGGTCILHDNVIVSIGFDTRRDPKSFTVPMGYRCDGASIPRLLRSAVSKYNACNAGIVHDYLYSCNMAGRYNRKEADKIFYLLLRRTKLSAISCFIAWLAVRIFGNLFFRK